MTIADAGSDSNVIIGNVVGASATGGVAGRARSAVANGSSGVFISRGATGTRIGGTGAGESNEIGFNGGNGVEVRATASKRNSVLGNRIYKNSGKGIALFDGSNEGVTKPQIGLANVPNSGTSAPRYSIGGSTAQPGTVEIFSDAGSQGETFLGRGTVAGGAFTFEVDAAPPDTNLTATFTDASGNTSEFGVFGLTDDDSDDDGVSDLLEDLAGTDPADPASTPQTVGFALAGKLQIKLNFAKPNGDSMGLKTALALPTPFVADGVTVGFAVAGHAEKLVLDAKGKASTGTVSIAVSQPKNKTPIIKGSAKKSNLQADLAPSGLTNRTTVRGGEGVVVPVAVTTSSPDGTVPTVYFGATTLTYKATKGKSGSAR